MTKEELIKCYKDWRFKCSAYEMALTIMNIDKQTNAPSKGAEYRDPRFAYLSGEVFKLQQDERMLHVMKDLLTFDLPCDLAKEIKLELEMLAKYKAVPNDFYVQHVATCNASFNAWLKAKKQDNYNLFKPYLEKMIENSKQLISYRGSSQNIYEQLLNDNESEVGIAFYDDFFSTIKEELLPFIKKVQQAKQIDDSFLHQDYAILKQKEFMAIVLKYINYTHDWGYQNESEHPFTTGICENDLRTTTKYISNNPISAVLSTVHECGHAYYEHQVNPKYDGTILLRSIKMGMHESQSRLLENYLGRSESFWHFLYPKLQSIFKEQLSDIPLADFVRAINKVEASLVRTEADELTYPIHILIRYELEKEIFINNLSVDRLEDLWNEKYQAYLGVSATKASQGILQDVHWSSGNFGYFPTYALGSAIAAQIFHRLEKEVDVQKVLVNDQFSLLTDWLKENVHQYGAALSFQELLQKCTGERFNIKYYITYLKHKFSKLYNLS